MSADDAAVQQYLHQIEADAAAALALFATAPPVTPPPAPVAPLTVTHIEAVAPVVAGQAVTLRAVIHNSTSAAIGNPGVGFYPTILASSGSQLAWAATDTIAANSDVTLDTVASPYHSIIQWTPTSAGTFSVFAQCGVSGIEDPTTKTSTSIVVSASAPTPTPLPTPTGTRDVTKWPYSSTSPWNLPICSGATFGPSLSGGSPFVLSDANVGYEPAVYVAKTSDPIVTVSVSGGSNPGTMTMRCPSGAQVPKPPGGDGHMTVIQPDGHTAYAFWAFVWTGATTATAGAMAPDDQRGIGWGIGWVRAAGCAASAGSIRAEEAAAFVIPHALGFGCPGQSVYGGTAGGPVWPAAPFFDHAGEGQLLAIPSGTPKPSLTPAGSAIWDALRNYGMYDVDTTGGGGVAIYTELHADPAFANQANGDIVTIMRACHLVTNASQTSPKGPGTPLVPLAPPA